MRAWLVVMLVACGQRPPPRDVTDEPDPPAADMVGAPRRVAVARPELALEHLVPDLHDELRWPLSAMSHPNLEPQFPIAGVFAQPGIGWIELCRRGVHYRTTGGRDREQLAYLRGWCAALADDVHTACATLAPLLRSTVRGMAAAARADLVNILVNHGDAGRAEHLLTRYRIDDPVVLDTLAAMYVELGKEHDAYEINRRVMGSDDHASAATRCRRLVKHIALSARSERARPLIELGDLARNPRFPDPTCVELDAAVRCWNSRSDCHDHFLQAEIDSGYVGVLRAYELWSHGPHTADAWLFIAQTASSGLGVPGGSELVVAALDNAIAAAGRCTRPIHDLIATIDLALTTAARAAVRERCAAHPR